MLNEAQHMLTTYFGYEQFRPHQEELIERVLDGQDVLGVMPTGAGKSLVYQIPALVKASEGLTLVVSPLISLMKDQVDALQQAGVAAACLNSSLTVAQRAQVLDAVEDGSCTLLYIAPERLQDPEFVDLCQRTPITLIAVDEAHCVSQWGKDFRPSYVGIAAFVASLPTRPCVCALTATATHEVREDIASALKLRDPFVCVAGFDRSNLYFGIERPTPAQKQACLLRLVKQRREQSGIIYCSTRKAVEEVSELLQSHGYAATLYHAGLRDGERKANQEDFLFDRKPLIVATNAFGMGIDKSNVSFVIHYNMPRDIESYYQEAGRAGRDGSPADCLLIYNKKDVQTIRYLARLTHEDRLAQGMEPELSDILYKRDLERTRQMTVYCTTPDCLRSFILRYFGELDSPFRCEHCSSCKAENETLDATTEAQKIISCVLRLDQRKRTVGRTTIIDILRGSEAQKIMQSGYNTLSTHGIMKDVPKPLLHTIFDALIAESLLQVSDGQYPVVRCTQEGIAFVKGSNPFTIKVAKTKLEAPEESENENAAQTSEPPSKQKRVQKKVGDGALDPEIDQDLFEELRALRARIANEQHIAAFIVFHDTTLRDMCAKLPATTEEFLTVSGVGETKAERYAEDFLACIAEYQLKKSSLS